MQLFATCPKGLENLLQDELTALGAREARATVAGVYFDADIIQAMRVCLHSRLANRVLLPLGVEDVASDYDLYSAAYTIDWHNHLRPDCTFAVDFTGTNDAIKNTQFGAMRIKDALVDKLRDHTGTRPNVDRHTPRFRVNARLAKNKVHIGIDLSGESLHRRGYRLEQGVAPLKENLAAAILMRANWPQIAAAGGHLIDPMCGSGTLLIEAALMAGNIAPGLFRQDFGFMDWLGFDAAAWNELIQEAQAQRHAALNKGLPLMLGCDEFSRVLEAATNNSQRAGVSDFIQLKRAAINRFEKPSSWEQGLILTNPPYGERLGEVETLKNTYQDLGRVVKAQCSGWTFGVFTGNVDLAKELRLRSNKRYKLFNGTIASELILYEVLPPEMAKLREDGPQSTQQQAVPQELPPLSNGATMLANRLRKNLKQFKSWVEKNSIDAYRLYDADMPEYSAAIDLYGESIHVQEYAAPKTIDPAAAAKRFDEIIAAVCDVFNQRPEHLAIKTRQRNKGKQQYEKLQNSDGEYFAVQEGLAEYWVNLTSYLDTGLFLDHRPLRRMVAAEAKGKRVLNLFCYTASITVQAILGGAKSSVSVDMSNTYLHWAKKNFELNKIYGNQHQLVQADCFKWLAQCREGFDLIILDPPSFSNSKRMEDVLDVQEDHLGLISRCMELLNPGGTLYFSTNLRSFKLDTEGLSAFKVADISAASIDPDFARNPKIHQCFRISEA
ncbi:MAG: bifunctional 23S rRNA (guanine(2069)-N(7))-methyltransferase RlmK/23S rRNA (guanine(2445)-N(2))-methyltransferase RlmL [Marinagarivorans sp.]